MHALHLSQYTDILEVNMHPANNDTSLTCAFLVVYKLMVHHLTIGDVLELKTCSTFLILQSFKLRLERL